MRRMLMFVSGIAVLCAALGCQHIGGKCDCGANPNDAVPNPIVTPYPQAAIMKPAAPPGNE